MTRRIADENIAALEIARGYIRKRFLAGEEGKDSVIVFIAGQSHVFPTMTGFEYKRQDDLLLAEIDCLNMAVRMVAVGIAAEEKQQDRGWSSGEFTIGQQDETSQLLRRGIGGEMKPATKQELGGALQQGRNIHVTKDQMQRK